MHNNMGKLKNGVKVVNFEQRFLTGFLPKSTNLASSLIVHALWMWEMNLKKMMMMSEALRGKVEESEYCFYRNLPETPSLSPTNLST